VNKARLHMVELKKPAKIKKDSQKKIFEAHLMKKNKNEHSYE
jgi:hypothetical protein